MHVCSELTLLCVVLVTQKSLLLFLKELASAFIRRLKRSVYKQASMSIYATIKFKFTVYVLLCTFLKCSERFSKSTWYSQIPEAVKLSEDSIDSFVKSLLPAARLSVFSKFGTMEASTTLHKLALVRPEMVLPDLLTRFVHYPFDRVGHAVHVVVD